MSLEKEILEWGGVEVSPMDVYRDMFHLGEGYIQKFREKPGEFKSNPLAYWKSKDRKKGHYRILFEDTFEETLEELQEADFCILNGLTYFGRKNLMENASKMYSMIFDLDDVDDSKLRNFFSGAMRAEAYPVPNYVVLSGHGVHLYYLFEEPVPLYPNIKLQLKSLKYALIQKMWNPYTSFNENPQYQGINQGFRVIGGKTKIDGIRTRAFRVNTHPFTLEQLCEYVPIEHRVDESKLWKESKLTLAEARKKYPEWYEKRIVQGDKSRAAWTCKRDLYDWWIRQIRDGASFHHRYFCIMCLAIYAMKSGIERDELEHDALSLVPFLNDLNPEEPFTEADCYSALECYDECYITFPIKDIEKITGITIPRNKRNGRKQEAHLYLARRKKEDMKAIGEEINEGRPDKSKIVEEWRKAHPDGKKADCIRETGLSKPTVYKWWK